VDDKKAFDNIRHPFHWKTSLGKIKIERFFFSMIRKPHRSSPSLKGLVAPPGTFYRVRECPLLSLLIPTL
jgi:hypothetical protein